jgi:hypothetical protein
MSPSSEGTENPLEARTMAGGTVIQPTLKHICDNAMVCTVAPSGSSDATSVSFVFSEVGVGVMLGKGVAVVDIVSAPGIRKDVMLSAVGSVWGNVTIFGADCLALLLAPLGFGPTNLEIT